MGLLVVAGSQLLVQGIAVAALSTSIALGIAGVGLLLVEYITFEFYHSGLLEPYETVGQRCDRSNGRH